MKIKQIFESVSVGGMGTGSFATAPSAGKDMIRRQPKENIDPADQGEYDREGDMAKDQLYTAAEAAAELRSILDADENLPEWVQSKITKAMDYLDTARDYMKSQDVEEGYNMGGLLPGKYYLHSIYMDSKVFMDPLSGDPKAFDSFDDAEDFLSGMSGREVDEYQISVFNKGQLQPADDSVSEGLGSNISTLDAVFNEHDFYRLEHIWPALEAGDKEEALRQINHYLRKGKNRAWWGDLQALDIKIDPSDVENSQVMWSKSPQQDMAVQENKKGVKAVKHTVKPRNFVAKNASATTSGAGAHKDKKKAAKQGEVKHKGKEPAYESRLWAALEKRIVR